VAWDTLHPQQDRRPVEDAPGAGSHGEGYQVRGHPWEAFPLIRNPRPTGAPTDTAAAVRRPRRLTAVRRAAGLGLLAVLATGCTAPNFGFPNGITVQSERVLNLWRGSAIAALAVGVFVWGLIFYVAFTFRKKSNTMPRQIQYNLPIEALYTVVPLVIVAGLFYYTARDEIYIDKTTKNPAVTVNVIGFRWNWRFDYLDTGKNGQPLVSSIGKAGEPPVLVLPTDRTIQFIETSPDVIHSFWVPEFLFKRDVVPGRQNKFELTIKKEGTYIGRCAELCGVDHDRMNFYVKVVSGPEYDRFIANAEAGATSGSGT
jgi:cytochrome c oxidase subunit II